MRLIWMTSLLSALLLHMCCGQFVMPSSDEGSSQVQLSKGGPLLIR